MANGNGSFAAFSGGKGKGFPTEVADDARGADDGMASGGVADEKSSGSIDASIDDYDVYERECERIRAQNKGFLEMFENDMRAHGLAESTIRRHLDNVDFYINEYLLYYDAHEVEFGCYDVAGFLGDFFIRKCMWSTPSTIKTNATSIKKFYKFMLSNGFISAEAYGELVNDIKENIADWQEACAEFNDPSNDPLYDQFDPDEALFNSISSFLGADPELAKLFAESFAEKLAEQIGELPRGDEPPANPPTREEVVEMLTLTLFYLTSWKERIDGKGGPSVRKAWKSADWDALDALREQGLVSCSNRAKSVAITDEGIAQAEAFLCALDLGHLMQG